MAALFNRIIVLLLVLFSTLSTYSIQAENNEASLLPAEIILVADQWCPYTCSESDDNPGLLVDIVSAAFNRLDMKVTFKKTSWVRSMDLTKARSDYILLGSTNRYRDSFTFSRQFYLPVESSFVHLAGKTYNIEHTNTLSNYRIGFVHGYEYDDNGYWANYLKELPYGVGISAALGEDHLFKLLDRGRVDLALINRDLAHYYMNNRQLKNEYSFIRQDIVVPVYLAFQKSDAGLKLMTVFEKVIESMTQDGSLNVIFKKYQVSMPDYFGVKNP